MKLLAPKERRNVATGEAQVAARRLQRNPWTGMCQRRPDGAKERCSFEHVLLIELDAVRAKQPQQFGLEVLLLVMRGLARDVFLHGDFLRFADGKDAVAFLPCECAEFRRGERLMNPF